jgi:thiopurine S-methyltransferase
MRERYTTHLIDITGKAQQLLICWEYDQNLMDGPPFSIGSDEVKRHYGKSYKITLIESKDVPGGLKGKCAATENVWLLKKG